VLPDGSVAITGGLGAGGAAVEAVERFDPITQSFSIANPNGITPRYRHTAKLLSDGQVLIAGGISSSDETLGGCQLWNHRTNIVTTTAGVLLRPRREQRQFAP
jgi:hypothetical protein